MNEPSAPTLYMMVRQHDSVWHVAVPETDLEHLMRPRRIILQDWAGTVLSARCGRWRNFMRYVQAQSLGRHWSSGYLQYPKASEPSHVHEVCSVDPMVALEAHVVSGPPAPDGVCPECITLGRGRLPEPA
jgi:hypothetical protein